MLANILLEYGKGGGWREMGQQEGGEYQGCGGGIEGRIVPICCPFQEACRLGSRREQVLGCWGGALTPTRALPQVCLLKTRAQVSKASLGFLFRATGQWLSACKEAGEAG